jgi:uncharacterized protein YbaA (DUF1428 family)
MHYIDGIIAAVPRENKAAYQAYAEKVNAFFLEYGALRIVDSWGTDVPVGKATDMRRAVAATEEEDITFGWVEWPDKATRDAAFAKMTDHEFASFTPPFDGKRMIFGGFEPIYDRKGDVK